METEFASTRRAAIAREPARLEDRAILTQHLAAAIRYVNEGHKLLRRQRDRIYFLGQSGRSTALAEVVLARLIASQASRDADREKFEELLAAVSA